MFVLLVVAVAYGTQAPALGVAEFAPAARNQPAPPPTTAGAESGTAGRAAWQSTTTTAPQASATTAPDGSAGPAAPTTKVGRGRTCVGSPPRQTDDPMSPACLATIFEGDNSGATSRGVSGTEIRVGVVISSLTPTVQVTIDALFEHFNQRFEFYGRRLVPVYLQGSASDPLAARARVAELVSQNIFAAFTTYAELVNSHAAFPIELAREGVVTVTRAAGMAWSDRTLYDPWHPYLWSVFPSAEEVQANLADFACTALAGKPARRAGDPGLQSSTRKFGIVAASQVTPPNVSVLARALEACTGQSVAQAEITSGADVRTGMERLKSAGVTTMFCICEDDYPASAYRGAHSAAFYPEWVLMPDISQANCTAECSIQAHRVSSKMAPPVLVNGGPPLAPPQSRMWFAPVAHLLGPGADFKTVLGRAEMIYPSLLVLASGIQGAGPVLTPDTFAQALMTTQFPNPGAGQAPYWQPSAGFGPGDHSFYDDFSVAWWNDNMDAMETAQGAQPRGSWCHLDAATRFRAGGYPADAESRLFNPDLPCR